MACPDENTLVAFASGSLQMADAARVEEHLDGCAICFSLVAELARTAPEDTEPTRMLAVSSEPTEEHERTQHAAPAPEESSRPSLLPPPRAGMRRPTPIAELPRAIAQLQARAGSKPVPGAPQTVTDDTVPSVTAVVIDPPVRTGTVIAPAPTAPSRAEGERIGPTSAPPTQLGRYTILHRVGAGGMGVVYAAHDRELGRRVALELIDAGGRDAQQCGARLLREAQAMAKLAHPNVVVVHDAGCIDGQVFVAMELVEGRTLDAWLADGTWTWAQKLALFVQAAHGLAAAHAAGIVHRDFKPANVFVAPGAAPGEVRVRVGDFGLARALESGPEDAPTTVRADSSISQPIAAITRIGAVPGTPAYMAPEQLEGFGDARIDQFAFCVALFEALYGRRPFEGQDAASLHARIVSGVPPTIPPAHDAPGWLGAIVLRGLSRDPERRFPSMLALLAAIEAAAQRRRTMKLAAAIAAGVVVVGGGGALIASKWSTGPCAQGAEQLAGVWDPARSDAIGAAITKTAVPYASASWPGARAELDRWSTSWVDGHRRACEATRKDGTQSEHQLELRMACLDRRLQELRGLTHVWLEADAQVVEHLHDAVAELVPPAVCDDASVLAAALPEDPSKREKVFAARETIAKARALEAAASYERALPLASEATAAADAVRDRSLQSEARVVLGAIHVGAGRFEDGARELEAAMQAAVAGGDPRLLARASSEYAYVAATWLGKPDAALQVIALGRAALERVPADRDLAADLWSRDGVAHRQAGRYPQAIEAFEKALAQRREVHGDADPSVAAALNDLAIARASLGQLDQALQEHERARAIREQALGADHPEVAMSFDNIGTVLAKMGRLDDALTNVRKGLALRERVLGPEHARVADSLNNLGVVLTELGHADEALASHRRALSIRETVLGSEHALVAASLNNIGFALVQLGRWNEAEATLQRAIVVGTHALGADHPDVATSHFNLGRAAHGRGDYERAGTELEIALASRTRSLGDRHATVGTTWVWIARNHRDRRQRIPAKTAAQAALAIIEPAKDPDAWAQARLVLADVLWEEGERGKARASVGEALATVRTSTGGQSAVAMLGAWQKARGEDEVEVLPGG
ncbi:MAG TPA: tetratricopeptide repeat protein [Nannocystaceae bacterium]|nr:tetratricopeptide repeat protein [Nannocystaceae bacterium]